jgi:ribonuclease P protein component
MLSLKKKERLKSQQLITKLYSIGNTFYYSPFKVIWLPKIQLPGESPAEIMISISKKSISSAVDRNHMRRRIKEAYRINKENYYNYLASNGKSNILILNYTPKKIMTFREIEAKIVLILQHLQSENEKADS